MPHEKGWGGVAGRDHFARPDALHPMRSHSVYVYWTSWHGCPRVKPRASEAASERGLPAQRGLPAEPCEERRSAFSKAREQVICSKEEDETLTQRLLSGWTTGGLAETSRWQLRTPGLRHGVVTTASRMKRS